jgi:hypothetical protein
MSNGAWPSFVVPPSDEFSSTIVRGIITNSVVWAIERETPPRQK